MLIKISAAVPLLLMALALGCTEAADPCYDVQDPETGNYGMCLKEPLCINGPVASDACPSFPADYVCCHHHVWPGREHRGVWIASVSNIDWPTSRTDSVAVQQQQLEHLVNEIARSGLNAIYFQVRPAGDSLYISDIEPWSIYLTGQQQGVAPSPVWDPLQYVIDLCTPLGIEVHAWINPYRAGLSPSVDNLAPNHMARMFPEYAYIYDTFVWMDPGSEAVQNRTTQVALDLVNRYDLAGLHMDDYFYPYPVAGWTFPDDATYADYLSNGGTLGKEDWRRDNVNKLVERLNREIHEVKPWVKYSVSPFGIFRAGHPEGMPPPIAGFDQYTEIYCDAKLWLQEGWLDILQPQLYWRIDPPAQSYPVLLDWWVGDTQNLKGRYVFAGNYLSRVNLQAWPWEEIRRQISISRDPQNRLRGSWGNVMFSAVMFRDNVNNTSDFFQTFIYPEPALSPVYPWLADAANAPSIQDLAPEVKILRNGQINFDFGAVKASRSGTYINQIAIYKMDEKDEWRLVRAVPLGGTSNKELRLQQGQYVATFIDRFGREGRKTHFKI